MTFLIPQTLDELDEALDAFLQKEGAADVITQTNSQAHIIANQERGGSAEDSALFTNATESEALATPTFQLADLQSENRKLRGQVTNLIASLQKRDEEIAVAHEKLVKLVSVTPSLTTPAIIPVGMTATGDVSRAKDLLMSKLGEFGFSSFKVENVLDGIQEARSADGMDLTVNEVLDRLLTSNDAALQPLRLKQGLNQSSFLGRNQPRRANGPSASQYGLFGDEGDEPAAEPQKLQESKLFGGVDIVSAEDVPRVKETRPGSMHEGKALEYNEFLGRLLRPENTALSQSIKLFVLSILGPYGNATPPQKSHASLEYQFYGTYMLRRRCADFFEVTEKVISASAAWSDLGEAGLLSARNHIEKYVMTKIADIAIDGERNEEQDSTLSRRMEVLDFITPEALEVNPNLRNEVVWTIAQDELRKMTLFKTPGDKIACVVKCCQVIFSVLNLKRGADDTSRPGADDFLPIFIFVVLKSKVPNLITNCEYIQNFHNPASLMSKAGYCFVNLRSAIEFILTLDASVLKMDPVEFSEKLMSAEKNWAESHSESKL